MALFEQRMVEIEGAMLEIVVGGAGQPLICTSHPCWPPNGLSAQAAQDDATLQSLAAVSSVVWVNPRGSGNSSPIQSTSDLTFHQLVEDLEAVRQWLSVARWVFAGVSGGGVLALLYALAYPQALAGLIVVNTTPSGAHVLADADSLLSPQHPMWVQDLEAAHEQIEAGATRRATRHWETLRPDLRIYCEGRRPLMVVLGSDFSERIGAAYEEFASFDVVDRLSEIGVPTLILAGRRDEFIPLPHCTVLARIPHAQFVVFEESGHDLDSEDPDRFRATVQRFIAEQVRT